MPLLLLLGLAFSALASSPEYLVGGTASRPAANGRYSPSIATDGDGFLVAWSDERSGSGSVVATRVTRDGRILDPLGIRIVTTPGWVTEPQAVWDGSAYLVAWTVRAWPEYRTDIFAARVAPDGGVVMQPRLIVEDAFTDRGRYLASNGTVSVIAYLSDAPRIAVLDRDGNLVRHERVTELDYVSDLTVAAGTSRFVVAWSTNPGYQLQGEIVQAVVLGASGQITRSAMTIGQGGHPAIGTDGSRFTIVSEENKDWQEWTLLSRTFDQNLTPTGDQRPIFTSRRVDDTHVLRVGNHYEVVTVKWVAGGVNELVSIALDGNGNPQGPVRSRGQFYGEPIVERLAAGTNGVDVLVVRATRSTPAGVGLQIFSQLYASNTAVPPVPTLVSWSGNAHRAPDIASSASGAMIAWAEDGGAFATRVDRSGNSLDGRGIALSAAPYGRVRVAFDGTNYVVAWREGNDVGVRYIAPLTGATVAEGKVPGEGWPADLALATSPDATYLLVADTRIRVTRIPSATHTPDPVPLAVSPEDMLIGYPAASWNGSALLVTWTEEYVHPRADPPIWISRNVYAARMTAGLSLLDPSPLLLATTRTVDGAPIEDLGAPSVASDGTDWLVATTFQRENIIARRVGRDGRVKGNGPVVIGDGTDPVVAWDGTQYAVAWKEGNDLQRTRGLMLGALPATGPLEVTKSVPVSRGTADSTPAIAATGRGESAVVYTKVSFLPEHAGVERSFFRLMDFEKRGRAMRF